MNEVNAMRCRRRSAAALVLAAVLTLLLAAAGSAQAGKRYALLIAINRAHVLDSPLRDLDFAVKDATELEKLLKPQDFEEVIPLVERNANRENILRELTYFAKRLKTDDEFVLFYSGHGVRNSYNRQTYWVTWSASLSQLDGTSIRLAHLMDYIREIKAQKKLVVLDHCYSGDILQPDPPTDDSMPSRGADDSSPPVPKAARMDPEEVREQLDPRGVVVISAAQDEAYESGDLQQGVFTKALLNALSSRAADDDDDGKLSVLELSSFVRKWVSKYKGRGKQVPIDWQAGLNLGDWIFAQNLPLNSEEVERLGVQYRDLLSAWLNRGLITDGTRSKTDDLLKRWQQAEAGLLSLSDTEAALLARIRECLGSRELESARSSALAQLFGEGPR